MGLWCNNKFYTSQCSILAELQIKKKKVTAYMLGPEISFSWKLVTDIRIPGFIIFHLTQFLRSINVYTMSHGLASYSAVAYPGIFFGEGGGGVQQIQLRTERTGIWGQ